MSRNSRVFWEDAECNASKVCANILKLFFRKLWTVVVLNIFLQHEERRVSVDTGIGAGDRMCRLCIQQYLCPSSVSSLVESEVKKMEKIDSIS